jgi:hypothetical protein
VTCTRTYTVPHQQCLDGKTGFSAKYQDFSCSTMFMNTETAYTVHCTHNRPPSCQYSLRGAPSDIVLPRLFPTVWAWSFCSVFLQFYSLDSSLFTLFMLLTTCFCSYETRPFIAWLKKELWRFLHGTSLPLKFVILSISWTAKSVIHSPFKIYPLNHVILHCSPHIRVPTL